MPDNTLKLSPEQQQKLSTNLGAWHLALRPDEKPAWFHQRLIIPAIERLLNGRGKRKLAICLPPGHGKSEVGTVSLIPFLLGSRPGIRAMTLSYSTAFAMEFGRRIRNICESDLATEVFPTAHPTLDSHGSKRFSTKGGSSYFAAGFNDRIAGVHYDFIGIDDPVKSMFEAQSEPKMRARFDVYRSVVKDRLRPKGKMLMSLTRYWLRDFFARVMEAEPDAWDILIVPAEDTDGKFGWPPDRRGRFLWSDYYGDAHYESAKSDQEVWWSVWQQQPRAFDEFWFNEDWFLTYKPGTVKRGWAHYMICDPGLAMSARSDRTSILVIAAGPENRVFVVDWVYDRLNPEQRAQHIVRLARKWKPRRFVYEEQGLVSDTFYLNQRMAKENLVLRPVAVGRKGPRAQLTKESRIRELRSDFAQARIWFPPSIMQKCADGSEIDVIATFRNEEFIPYRGEDSVRHDDGLDSLSRIHDPELRIQFIPEPDGRPERREPQRGGWEAAW